MIILIAGGDAADELALPRLAGYNGKMVVDLRLRAGFDIEAQVRLAPGLVRSVALVTGVRENGPDVAIELDGRRQRLLGAQRGDAGHERERQQKAVVRAKLHREFIRLKSEE